MVTIDIGKEGEIVQALEDGGTVLVSGPEHIGRHTLVQRAINQFGAKDISFDLFRHINLPSSLLLLNELASDIVTRMRTTSSFTWPEYYLPYDALNWVLEKQVLPNISEHLVLVIAGAERLADPLACDFCRAIRCWIQIPVNNKLWGKFHVLFIANGSLPSRRSGCLSSFYYNIKDIEQNTIILDGWNWELTKKLGLDYKLSWDDEQIKAITSFTGGQPALIDIAIQYAKWTGASAQQIIEGAKDHGGIFVKFLENLSYKLHQQSRINGVCPSDIWYGIIGGQDKFSSSLVDIYEFLYRIGLIRSLNRPITPFCELYRNCSL